MSTAHKRPDHGSSLPAAVAARILVSRDGVRARAFAVVESCHWLTTGAGAMLAPLLIAAAGPRGALAITGIALPGLMLARWAAVVRLASPLVTTVAPETREQRVLEPV